MGHYVISARVKRLLASGRIDLFICKKDHPAYNINWAVRPEGGTGKTHGIVSRTESI